MRTSWNEQKVSNGGCGISPKGMEENALLLRESYYFHTEWVLPLAISWKVNIWIAAEEQINSNFWSARFSPPGNLIS